MLKAAKPFSDAPTFSFQSGLFSINISLPVHVISFCSPANLSEEQFNQHWDSLNGKEVSRRIDGAINVASVGQMMPRMRFGGVVPGKVVQGATTFRVGGQSIGVLAKVDCKTGVVYVRSNHAETCKGVINCFEIVLNN